MELDEFVDMWTTDAWKYVLSRHDTGYLPIDISGKQPMAVVIEDDALNAAVTERMLAAGVPVREPGNYFANPS